MLERLTSGKFNEICLNLKIKHFFINYLKNQALIRVNHSVISALNNRYSVALLFIKIESKIRFASSLFFS